MANDLVPRPELRLLQAWINAEQQESKPGALRVVPFASSGRDVHLSVTSEGWRGLVLPLCAGEVVSVPKAFRGGSAGALRAEVAQFSYGPDATDALHIWCRDPKCKDAFTSFSVFLLDRVRDERALGVLLTQAYAEFERLLGRADAVDRLGLTGLVGELLVLLEGVRTNPRMVMFWAGPRGERHDFRSGSTAIEVKSSLRSELAAHRVRISDWDQLEVPENGRLYLHSIRFEQVAGGDWSVPRLLRAIRFCLNGEGLAALEDLLAKYDSSLIRSSLEFSVKERSTYHVTDGFPKLVASMLSAGRPLGVSGVSYTLDLDHAEFFKVDWNSTLMSFFQGEADA